LDEVGDIPLDLQAKLLRVLQEGEYERIGEDRTRRANVRILAATNRNLEVEIAAGRFRCDLYYRLNTFPIYVPPLRERGDDVVRLAQHFLSSYACNAGRRGLSLQKEHEAQLRAYDWPGNVRELQHVIERAVILSTDAHLRLDLALPKLSSALSPSSPPRAPASPHPSPTAAPVPMTEFKRLERDNLMAALIKTRWRIAGAGGAAELLGMAPSTLRDRMRALRIDR
jgi:transcriptional regulator with GAF, ATPase, and Fis domain